MYTATIDSKFNFKVRSTEEQSPVMRSGAGLASLSRAVVGLFPTGSWGGPNTYAEYMAQGHNIADGFAEILVHDAQGREIARVPIARI